MTDIAHFNMVEQQIRPWNVHSVALLEAMTGLDRSVFVPAEQHALCFFDTQIKLDDHAFMLAPKVAARLVQALNIEPDDHVLVVGAGSGYSAALCARLSATVICQDTDQQALDRASRNCAAAGVENISFQKLEERKTPGDKVQYDAILVREGQADSPLAHIKKLSAGGRCVALVGDEHVMELMRYTLDGKEIEAESLIDILTPENDPLVGTVEQKAAFVF